MPDEYSYNRPLSPGTEITYRLPCDTGTDSPPGKGRVKNAGFYVILVINDDGYEQFVFYDELLTVNEVLPHMSIDASKLYVGAIILYKLLPAENPTNPDRLWRGRTNSYLLKIQLILIDCGVVEFSRYILGCPAR